MKEAGKNKTTKTGKASLEREGLRAEKICKTYGTQENPVYALKETSFQIPGGQFAAILGPSGCGKSTLLHVLGGIEEPDGGSVWIKGKDLYQMERSKRAVFRRRSIGMVYQSIFLLPALNIEENIILPLLLDGRRARGKTAARIIAGDRAGSKTGSPSQPAFRWTAAAGRHCQSACHVPFDPAGRRAHREPG